MGAKEDGCVERTVPCLALFGSNANGKTNLLRAWKNQWDVPVGGLLIDTLTYSFWKYRNESFTYHDWLARDFLECLSNADDQQSCWYAVGTPLSRKIRDKGGTRRTAARGGRRVPRITFLPRRVGICAAEVIHKCTGTFLCNYSGKGVPTFRFWGTPKSKSGYPQMDFGVPQN